MGSSIQQILPGRGDKKGKSIWLKTVPVILLVAAWAGLLFEFPVRFSVIWFPFTAVTIIACSILHFLSKRQEHAIEFLYSVLLFSAGLMDISGLPWLKLAYFPFLVAMLRFYGLNVIIPLAVLVPFNELRTFTIRHGNILWEAAYSFFLVLTAVVASFVSTLLRREKERAENELKKIRADAKERAQDTEMASLGSDEIISHYLASRIRANEEIQELLNAIKQAVYADAVHFFEPQGNTLSVRSSTDEKGKIMITGKGIIASCIRDRKPFFSGEFDEDSMELGYLKDSRIMSVMAIPIIEGSTPVGLLSVDTTRFHAFTEQEQNIVRIISGQIARILERERIYNILKHDITALRMIKEFSSGLAASIQYDIIIKKLCDSAGEAFSGRAFFVEHSESGLTARHFPGNIQTGRGLSAIRDTLLGDAVGSRQMKYISDTGRFGMKIFPQMFDAGQFLSVIVLPLLYEDAMLGIFCMISQEREFLDSRQLSLVQVMCNQASTSLANAKMHAEIERMASTDGLTGLLNHRLFQQKLSEEIARSERYKTSLSLLLTDIDFFKKVNDTYGHPVGDIVLKGVSKILSAEVRDIDIPARYGGEEFAVVLPGTDPEGARAIAERVRKAVMAETFAGDGKTLKVTMSIGIASVPVDAKTKEEMIEKADQALYHAKHNGRNRVVNWSEVK